MKVALKKSLGYADVVIYDNGIFHIHVLSNVSMTLCQVKEINDLRVSHFGKSKALVLSSGEDSFVVPTQEAVEYLQSTDRNLSVKATAFVIKSFSQRLAIKAASVSNKMTTPTSYFATLDKAVEWLLSIKD